MLLIQLRQCILTFILLVAATSVVFGGDKNPCTFFPYFSLDQSRLTAEQGVQANAILDRGIVMHQAKMQRRNEQARQMFANKTASQQTQLKHMTFNTGLLNRLFGLAYVPDYAMRRQQIPPLLAKYLEREQPAFVTLQEVWDRTDGEAITQIAEAKGYLSFSAEQRGRNNPFGLQTLVRADLLAPSGGVQALSTLAMPQQFVEKLAGLKKGIFPVRATLANGKTVMIINAHFAYSPQRTTSRLVQAQILSEYLQKSAAEVDYVIVGSDTNSSDRFEAQFDAVGSGWFKDKSVYLGLVEANDHIHFRDSYAANPPTSPGFTQDPTQNDLTRFSKSTKSEPAQRLDYIFVGSRHEPINFYIDRARMVFTEPLTDSSGAPLRSVDHKKEKPRVFPSDHFGLESIIHVAN